MRREPCACGGVIEADPADPGPAVLLHTTTLRHRRWRNDMETRTCPGYMSPCAVTIPADRDLCHFCKGTRRLVERRAA